MSTIANDYAQGELETVEIPSAQIAHNPKVSPQRGAPILCIDA